MTMTRTEGAALLTEMPCEELDLLVSDCTLEELGDAFGLTRERVRQILVERGVTTRYAEVKAERRRAEILRLAPTHTVPEIAMRLGLSYNGVLRYVDPGVCKPSDRTVWTKDVLISEIRRFADLHGTAPGARDWNPQMARAQGRPDIAERWEREGWPTCSRVQYQFGSWNAGLRAAGFDPRRPGLKRSDRGEVYA